MPQVSFCCSNGRRPLLDRRVVEVENLSEARERAMALVHSLAGSTTQQDWRRCRLHARDDRGAEIFVMPFWSTPGKSGLKTRLRAVFGRALS
jgi:hypothetical protein